MLHFNQNALATAFIKPGTPMLADLLLRLQDSTEDLSASRSRDLASGLRGIARALGLPLNSIPADLKWLQPRLAKVAPAAFGMTAKSWSNTLSNARAALFHFNLAKPRANRSKHLSAEWQALWSQQQATDEKAIGYALCNFVFFLSAIDIVPDEVCSEHAIAYRDALTENEIRKSPDGAFRKAVQGWNRAVARHPFWPRQTLSVPSRSRTIAPRLADLPESFASDLETYLADLSSPDPLAMDGLIAPLRPSTIKNRRYQIMRFVGILLLSGLTLEDMAGLHVLVATDHADRGLRYMLKQKSNQKTGDIEGMAVMLHSLAKTYVHSTAADIKVLSGFVRKLTMPRQMDMTAKNRSRLRAVSDPAKLQKLLTLPERLFARAERAPHGQRAILEREDAIALAILQVCPIRRKNLTEIHLDRNLHRPGDGSVYLVFEQGETKTRRVIEFMLPVDVVRMIDRHIATRSPILCPTGTRWLFPKRDGSGPFNLPNMSTKISTRIRRELGLEFNAHLHRHLAAKILLTEHPGHYEVVRRLLGHSSISHTLSAYTGFDAAASTQMFADVINKARTA
jgi:integrase